MIQRSMLFRGFALVVLALLARAAAADKIKVMNSGGFSAAYKALQPKFEAASGHTLATAWGPSMGASPEAIPNRLARGESADVVTVEGLRAALLQAKSIAYSDSASGVYVDGELFKKPGIEDQTKAKAKKIKKTPVAEMVASGQYEIGFQRVSELMPVAGADFVPRIPEPVQYVTTFSAGVLVASIHPEAARALIRYLASPAARDDVVKSGLDLRP